MPWKKHPKNSPKNTPKNTLKHAGNVLQTATEMILKHSQKIRKTSIYQVWNTPKTSIEYA